MVGRYKGKFLHLLHPTIFPGRSFKEGRKRMAKDRNTPSFLPSSPPSDRMFLLSLLSVQTLPVPSTVT